ncbi:MAG TPA: hypothetical protein VFM18_22150 [Methanosarcina sp.]|nr:hypothetical protein [Methanosarcina sp.]
MKASTWVIILVLVQFAVMEQWLPSCISPFDKTHEDLLYFMALCTFFIVKAIEEKR